MNDRTTVKQNASLFKGRCPTCRGQLVDGPTGGLTLTYYCPHGGHYGYDLSWYEAKPCSVRPGDAPEGGG
jgi:hypothetical protein